jgi:hypothetical protein
LNWRRTCNHRAKPGDEAFQQAPSSLCGRFRRDPPPLRRRHHPEPFILFVAAQAGYWASSGVSSRASI